jgi:hypothetical protein
MMQLRRGLIPYRDYQSWLRSVSSHSGRGIVQVRDRSHEKELHAPMVYYCSPKYLSYLETSCWSGIPRKVSLISLS